MEQNENQSDGWGKLREELETLDKELVEADGIQLKPSQCYRITNNSLHVIYNTNCPDVLKERIETLLSKYSIQDENYPSQQEFYFP